MTSALDAAKYLLTLDSQDAGDLTSNLKLQKLLYYAQGVTLALRDVPLFDARIEAWEHGPVCPPVYHAYKQHGSDPIPPPQEFDSMSLPGEDREILNEVHTVYGQFSAWRLREMTHEEPPYKGRYRPGEKGIEIPRDALKAYFSTRVTRG
jgi:uncharacterized phage-associated protein